VPLDKCFSQIDWLLDKLKNQPDTRCNGDPSANMPEGTKQNGQLVTIDEGSHCI